MYLKLLFVLMIIIEYQILITPVLVLFYVPTDLVYPSKYNLWIDWGKKVGRISRFAVVLFARKCRIFCHGKLHHALPVEHNSDIRSEGKL